MAANYAYFDGTTIEVDVGIHGIDANNPNGAMVILKSMKDEPLYVAPDLSLDLSPMIPVVSRQHNFSSAYNTFDNIPLVEFICFGHSHRYYIFDYPEVAPYWRQHLFTEARILARSLQGDQAIAYEFLEGDGSLGAWLTHGIRAIMDIAHDGPIVTPADYDPLFKRVWDTSGRVKAATADDYAVLHEAGIEFMRIRYEQANVKPPRARATRGAY